MIRYSRTLSNDILINQFMGVIKGENGIGKILINGTESQVAAQTITSQLVHLQSKQLIFKPNLQEQTQIAQKLIYQLAETNQSTIDQEGLHIKEIIKNLYQYSQLYHKNTQNIQQQQYLQQNIIPQVIHDQDYYTKLQNNYLKQNNQRIESTIFQEMPKLISPVQSETKPILQKQSEKKSGKSKQKENIITNEQPNKQDKHLKQQNDALLQCPQIQSYQQFKYHIGSKGMQSNSKSQQITQRCNNTFQILNPNCWYGLSQALKYCSKLQTNQVSDIKSLIIRQLYDNYLQFQQDNSKYIEADNLLMLVQYIRNITINDIQEEFDLNTMEQVRIFVNNMRHLNEFIETQQQFISTSQFIQHVEYTKILIEFGQYLSPDQIDWKQIFYNLENRVQFVQTYADKQVYDIIIIRRVFDQHIFVTYNVQNHEFFDQLSEKETYDVIVVSKQFKVIKIQQLHIRYLSYSYHEYDSVILTLAHPNSIISLSVYKVNITNIQQCKQLKNMYSEQCQYIPEHFIAMKYLKRIVSINDVFSGPSTLLEQLFKNNQLQYALIYTEVIINKQIILRQNIRDLRFLYLLNQEQKVMIELRNEIPLKITSIKPLKQFQFSGIDKDKQIQQLLNGLTP